MNEIIFLKEIPESLIGKVVCIDGCLIKNSFDFLTIIWKALDFPYAEHRNWDAYLDWMRDFSWIKEKAVSIVILNFEDFLRDELDAKKFFLSDLQDVVFPYWENEAGIGFENNDMVKELHIYCIQKKE